MCVSSIHPMLFVVQTEVSFLSQIENEDWIGRTLHTLRRQLNSHRQGEPTICHLHIGTDTHIDLADTRAAREPIDPLPILRLMEQRLFRGPPHTRSAAGHFHLSSAWARRQNTHAHRKDIPCGIHSVQVPLPLVELTQLVCGGGRMGSVCAYEGRDSSMHLDLDLTLMQVGGNKCAWSQLTKGCVWNAFIHLCGRFFPSSTGWRPSGTLHVRDLTNPRQPHRHTHE